MSPNMSVGELGHGGPVSINVRASPCLDSIVDSQVKQGTSCFFLTDLVQDRRSEFLSSHPSSSSVSGVTLGFPSAKWGKELSFEGCDMVHRKLSLLCMPSDRKSSLRDAGEEGKKVQIKAKKAPAAKQAHIENKWQSVQGPRQMLSNSFICRVFS